MHSNIATNIQNTTWTFIHARKGFRMRLELSFEKNSKV